MAYPLLQSRSNGQDKFKVPHWSNGGDDGVHAGSEPLCHKARQEGEGCRLQ